MKNFFKKIHLSWIFTLMSLQAEWQYRFRTFIWIINGSVTPLVLTAIWLVVSTTTKLSLSSSQIVTYYLLIILMGRITQVWSLEDLGRLIRNGEFSFKLVKPYPYLLEQVGQTFGSKTIRFVALIPAFILIYFLFQKSVNFSTDLNHLLLTSVAAVIGLAINFFWENFLAIVVFYIGEYESLTYLNYIVYDFLSGRLIPLALVPLFLKNFMIFTPYRYLVSFPVEIFQNQLTLSETIQGFGIAIFFLLVLWQGQRIFFRNAIKEYSAFGN